MPKNSGNANQQAKVKNTVQEWSKYANIKFQNVAYDSTKPAGLRITFDPSSGSWCYVAEELKNVPANQPTTNLGWIDPSSITTNDDTGVILHEFGHALGFLHEHQSPARGGTLTLNRDGRSSSFRYSASPIIEPAAVISFYTSTQGWTADQVQKQILDVYNLNDVSNFSALDLTSIMMYDPSFLLYSVENSPHHRYFIPAQMNLEHIEVPPNNKLSELDKAFAFINYPYPAASPFDSKWTIDHALAVAGVDVDSKTKILQAYSQQDWVNVRYYFSLFTTSAHTASSNTAPHGVTSVNNTKPSTPADNDYRVTGYCDTN